MILAFQAPLQGSPPLDTAPIVACDAELAAIFAPRRPLLGAYEVCTTSAPLEAVIASSGLPYGNVEALGPLDAFGTAGPYDRSLMSRLYGGTRANVAHGWRQDGGRFVSTTLISPYPDRTLMHLIDGTMEIRWTIRQPAEHHEAAKDTKTTNALTASVP